MGISDLLEGSLLMNYPQAPLGETYQTFVRLYLEAGGAYDAVNRVDPRNPWRAMLSVAGIENWKEWLHVDLSRVRGGIAGIPDALNWTAAFKEGVTRKKFLPDAHAEMLYKDTHRAATLAETILFAATRPKVGVRPMYVSLTRETGLTPDGTPCAICTYGFDRTTVRLVPREDRSTFWEYLVLPHS